MCARSAAPSVYSVYMMRRSWSIRLRAWPLSHPNPAINRLMSKWCGLGRDNFKRDASDTGSLSSGQKRDVRFAYSLHRVYQIGWKEEIENRYSPEVRRQSSRTRRSTSRLISGSLETKITDQDSSLEQSRRSKVSLSSGSILCRLPLKTSNCGRVTIMRANSTRRI